jgi:hypothetical protein
MRKACTYKSKHRYMMSTKWNLNNYMESNLWLPPLFSIMSCSEHCLSRAFMLVTCSGLYLPPAFRLMSCSVLCLSAAFTLLFCSGFLQPPACFWWLALDLFAPTFVLASCS